VAYGFLNLYDGSYDLLDRHTGEPITENRVSRRYVSETVHDQLRLLAAEGLEPVERVVFADIDNLNKLFGKMRNGRIVSGICVLRLMLLYRDRVVRDSIRLALPRSGERESDPTISFSTQQHSAYGYFRSSKAPRESRLYV
jgi:hypothetical protein